LRSPGRTRHEPTDQRPMAPVTMIGPSAPNGRPHPIENPAADPGWQSRAAPIIRLWARGARHLPIARDPRCPREIGSHFRDQAHDQSSRSLATRMDCPGASMRGLRERRQRPTRPVVERAIRVSIADQVASTYGPPPPPGACAHNFGPKTGERTKLPEGWRGPHEKGSYYDSPGGFLSDAPEYEGPVGVPRATPSGVSPSTGSEQDRSQHGVTPARTTQLLLATPRGAIRRRADDR